MNDNIKLTQSSTQAMNLMSTWNITFKDYMRDFLYGVEILLMGQSFRMATAAREVTCFQYRLAAS